MMMATNGSTQVFANLEHTSKKNRESQVILILLNFTNFYLFFIQNSSNSYSHTHKYLNMKLLSWNVCGFGNKDTRNHLQSLIRARDHDVIFLSETKNQMKRMQYLKARYNFPTFPSINLLECLEVFV